MVSWVIVLESINHRTLPQESSYHPGREHRDLVTKWYVHAWISNILFK